MKRRTFLIEAGKAFPIVAGALYIVGCDSNEDDGNGNPPPSGMTITTTSTTDAGHSHSASIPEDDLDLTSNKVYTSSNDGGHVHTVALTAADFATLAGGGEVTVTSSLAGSHTHDFTFRAT
jgi:hypothetical protein